MTHDIPPCCPCEISCPVPVLECEEKSGSASKSGSFPFVQPEGGNDDDIPTLYEDSDLVNEWETTGEAWFIRVDHSDSADVQEAYAYGNYVSMGGGGGGAAPTTWHHKAIYLDENDVAVCDDVGEPFWGNLIQDYNWQAELDEGTYTCTATVRTHVILHQTSDTTPLAPQPLECAHVPVDGGFGSGSTVIEFAHDLDELRTAELTLTDEFTKESLVGDADDDMDDDWSSGGCVASRSVTWPTIAGGMSGSPAAWPDCEDGTQSSSGSVHLKKMRFRFVIPNNFDMPPAPAPQKWHGEYHEIEYKLVFTPDDGGAVVETLGSVEWTGPGTIGDDNSWKTDWVEVAVPPEEGTTTVVITGHRCTSNMAIIEV